MVYFTIFRAIESVKDIDLGPEIQTNCKNWVWKEKSDDPSMGSHCRIKKFLILKM